MWTLPPSSIYTAFQFVHHHHHQLSQPKAMAKLTLPLPIWSLLLMLLCLNSEMVNLICGQEMTWCVAKPSSANDALTANIAYACDHVGDCQLIQEGGGCYLPNTDINHASVVMNLYYQRMGRNNWNCDFMGSALIVNTDPSYPGCYYEFVGE